LKRLPLRNWKATGRGLKEIRKSSSLAIKDLKKIQRKLPTKSIYK